MKPRSLFPLVIVLVILVALVVMRQSKQRTPGIAEQAGLVALLPDGLSKADVNKLELYNGKLPDDKLVLALDASADKWRVTTHFNAPAKKETVEKYLDSIVKLKGEPRAMGASDAQLEEYNLTDDKAFHLTAFKKEATEPLFHLLIGKTPGYKTVFIRKAGSNDVFVEETNLKQQAGITDDSASRPPQRPGEKTPDDTPKKPEATTWLDKEILKVDTSKITKLALNLPDKSLVFERHEKPKPADTPATTPPAAPSAPAASSEEDEDETAPPIPGITPGAMPGAAPNAAQAKPQYEWTVVSGGFGTPLKQKGLDTLIQKFASLTATDVVDPAKKADWALATPAYTCVLSVEGQPDIRIEGGRPSSSGDGYVRVADAKEDMVYTLNKYTFEQIFAKGTDLFDLTGLMLDKATIQSIDMTLPDGKVALAKSGDTWTVAAPVADLKTQSTTLDTIATTLAAWKPVDYADAASDLGEPTRVVTVAAAGQSHTIKLYKDSKHLDGVYARLDDGEKLLVMSRTDVGKVFVAPKDLFQRALLDIDEEGIAEISATSPAGAFSLVKKDADWKLTANGATSDAEAAACDKLVTAATGLQATDILFGRADLPGPAQSTLRLKMSDGSEHVLSFGAEKDGTHPLKLSGRKETFTVGQSNVAELFPAVDTLKKPETPAPAPAAEPPAASSAAPAVAEPLVVAPASAPAPGPMIVTPTPPEPAKAPAAPPAPPAPDSAK
jgi:hypothetical protein